MDWHDSISELILGIVFLTSLGKYVASFHYVELVIITMCLSLTSNVQICRPLMLASFYGFAFNDPLHILNFITLPILFGYGPEHIQALFTDVLHIWHYILTRLMPITLACSLCQILGIFLCDTNIRRKFFHLFAFLVFYDCPSNLHRIGQHALYILIFASQTKLPAAIFRRFISEKDYGPGIYSHIFLLSGMLYANTCLAVQEYNRLLIAICFMDSAASIAGSYMNYTSKSFVGFICGQVSAYIAEYVFSKSIDFRYYTIMGLLEYKCNVNDNVLLPFASVVYSRMAIGTTTE